MMVSDTNGVVHPKSDSTKMSNAKARTYRRQANAKPNPKFKF
jgi:hypothetical protein